MLKTTTAFELSVIIPTYNRCELLRYTLNSLVKQNISREKFEVIIGDDGSSDDTRQMLIDYEKLLNIKYVFQEDKGYRPASARNNALRLAEGEICLFIDSGVIVHEQCIAEHILFHRNVKCRSAAIGYVYGFDHDEVSEDLLKKLVIPADPNISIERLDMYEVFRDVREPQYVKYNDCIDKLPAPWFYFWTCHVSVLRTDIDRVGLFDENYDGRWGVEDQDLGLRLQLDGVRICLLRSAKSLHYPHGKNRAQRHLEGYQNCLYFHDKFNTPETGIYLNCYRRDELTDINEISLKASGKKTSKRSVGYDL